MGKEKDFQMLKGIVSKILKTQNNLIDKLKHFEVDNITNLIELDTRIKKLKENKDRADFASECFMKQIKMEKHIKINNANIHLLEMRMDNIDKKINTNVYLLEDRLNKINIELIRSNLRIDLMDKFVQNFLLKKINQVEKHCKN